jgi:hypothetical protein
MAFVLFVPPTPSTTRSHVCAYVTHMKDTIYVSVADNGPGDVTYGAVRWPRSYEISPA